MASSWKKLFASGLAASSLPAAHRVLVDDQKLQDAIVVENLLAHTQALENIAYASPDRNRFVGTVGHNNTIQYIVAQLDALGGYYDVDLQPFNATVSGPSNVTFVASTGTIPAGAFSYSDSIELTDTAIVPVANLGCDASDFPSTVAGSIALISRGTCNFVDKAFFAKSAGALASIIYNNVEGDLRGTLFSLNASVTPTAGITRADGLALLAAATNGTTPLTARSLDIDTNVYVAYSYNVIATTTYATNTSDILFFGAHSDSVLAGPGINDNGSGSAGILEAAIQLARGGYTAIPTIKFAWWTAEEEGLLGSEAYVHDYASQEELNRIRLYFNYDMIASPNYILGVYDGDSSEFPEYEPGPAGSAEAEELLVAWFEAQGYGSVATAFTGRSDYGPFLDAGIPAGGIFTGAEVLKTEEEVALFGGVAGAAYDANYHLVGDNATNINAEAFLINSKAIAHSVAYYGAGGFDAFPLRNTTALAKRRAPPSSHEHGQEKKDAHVHEQSKKDTLVKKRPSSHGHAGCYHHDEL